MKRWLFGIFLAVAAGQDLKKQRVDLWIYLLFGGLATAVVIGSQLSGMVDEGMAAAVLAGSQPGRMTEGEICLKGLAEVIRSICPGLVLLGVGKVSRGGIGTGDGCFFLISGLLISFWENMMILGYGTLLCGLYSLGYLVWKRMNRGTLADARRHTIPFLPFLLPPGIWLLCNGGML